MNTKDEDEPGASLFKGEPSIFVGVDDRQQEEEEELEDRKRRDQEVFIIICMLSIKILIFHIFSYKI